MVVFVIGDCNEVIKLTVDCGASEDQTSTPTVLAGWGNPTLLETTEGEVVVVIEDNEGEVVAVAAPPVLLVQFSPDHFSATKAR